jgi:aminoglycoside phosphotransferase (APT) family kinase protein
MSNATSDSEPIKLHIGVSTSRDLDQTRLILGEWLRGQIPDASSVEVVSLQKPKGNGGSSETYFAAIDARSAGETRRLDYVLRLKPSEFRMFLRENFDEQYRLITFLGTETDVPVPKIPYYEPDPSVMGVPFWLMAKVEGEVPSDLPPFNTTGFVFDATIEQRRKLWRSGLEAATKLAKVDVSKLPHILDLQPGESGLDENLRYWTAALDWATEGRQTRLQLQVLDWLYANKPSRGVTGLSHGDCRIGNMIFRDFECAAVLDYDTITLAGPQLDLAHWLVMDEYFTIGFGLDPLPGIGNREETIAQWEALMGMKADQLGWHEVLTALRLEVNTVRGLTLLPPEIRDPLYFDDGETVISRQLRRVYERVSGDGTNRIN